MQEAAATRDGLVERAERACDHLSMTAIEQSTLETARLRLRPLEMTDAVALNVIQSDPVHMQFYPHPFSLDESREWIERMRERRERDGFSLLAVEDRAVLRVEEAGGGGSVRQVPEHADAIHGLALVKL